LFILRARERKEKYIFAREGKMLFGHRQDPTYIAKTPRMGASLFVGKKEKQVEEESVGGESVYEREREREREGRFFFVWFSFLFVLL